MEKNYSKIDQKRTSQGRGVQSKRRYLASFLIGTGVFVAIFFLANYLSYLEFNRVVTLQGKTAYGIFETKLESDFFSQDICADSSLSDISAQLGFQGAIIDDLEKKLGKHNDKVLFQKKFYTLVELEHLGFILDYNEACDMFYNTIMFFYSNSPKDNGKSEEVGRLLDAVYTKYPENVRIYSFDVDLDSEVIRKLKAKYGIDGAPTLIINQDDSVYNPQNIREIETYLE